jgi:NADH-quinone oxidoreductase subunit D
MKQSILIIEQCLDNIPFGPIKSSDNKVTPPSRFDIKQSMESQFITLSFTQTELIF